ncbi:MAG TPA: serine--tRNA ligase [Bacteroidota bacterium]|nr:serine--tRNA ligase [Bacteroidota bacterium]
MLDIKLIREHTAAVKQGIAAKFETDNIDKILELDEQRRHMIQEVEALKAKRNEVSAKVAHMKKAGEDASAIIDEMNTVKARIQALDEELKVVDGDLKSLLLSVPNLPHPSVPVGRTPDDNQVVFEWGEKPAGDFTLKPHWDIADALGLLDFTRGSKVAGAGFPFYVGKGAQLQRALINFFLDQAGEHGYRELQTPIVVNEDSARGTGQIPDKEDLMYVCDRDGFFMIPTAEVPVTNFHRDETFTEKELPIHYAAYTPCFRREAGSYGKDVRGLNRLHQFDKVELVKFVTPSTSYAELDTLRLDAERLLQLLGLPYHTLLMCTGDMGFTQSKKFDLEVWAAGQSKWLEVSSCSNFESFQARRMNIRYKSSETGKTEFVHTINGSGLALPRVMAAIIENYQTPEGKIIVPKVLHPYTKFTVIG